MPVQAYDDIGRTEERELGISPLGMILVVISAVVGLALFLDPASAQYDLQIGSVIVLSIALAFGAGLQRWQNQGDLGRTFLYALAGSAFISIMATVLAFANFSVTPASNLTGTTLLLVLALPAIFEELLFRSGVFLAAKRIIGTWPAVIVQALLFAIYHSYVGLDMAYFMLLLVGGVVLQLVFLATKDITSAMLAHAIINLRPFMVELLLTPAVLIVIGLGLLFYVLRRRI